MAACRGDVRAAAGFEAFVLRRSDFRESSRVVTLWGRGRGRLTVLAKGAHRDDSPLQGRIDRFDRLRVTVSGRGELPILARAELLHEPRALRQPRRFLLACHLQEMCEVALPVGRVDEALFDLFDGGLTLLQRCPAGALRLILLGLEWRMLDVLGMQPGMDRCALSGAELPLARAAWLEPLGRGLAASPPRSGSPRVSAGVRRLLLALAAEPARAWHELRPSEVDLRGALALVGRWLGYAVDRRPRVRAPALRLLGEPARRGLSAVADA